MNKESMREAFEELPNFDRRMRNGQYVSFETESMWQAYQAGAASFAKDAERPIPWDFEPALTSGNEPSIASLVHRYFHANWSREESAKLTLEYMAALDARATGEKHD